MFGTTFDKKTKLWRGPDILPLYNPKVSIAQVLLNAMTTYGPKIAQVSPQIAAFVSNHTCF